MEKNSFISNFKKLPLAFLAALVLIALAECAFFSKLWILTDWNMLSIYYKKSMLKHMEPYDAVFFGDSVLWSLDGKRVQDQSDGQKVFNYYIANLGPSFNLSLTFKQYIKHKGFPKVLFISVRPAYFYEKSHGDLAFERPYQNQQFRRYIDWATLALNLPYRIPNSLPAIRHNLRLTGQFLSITKEYITHFLPSSDFNAIFRQYGPPFLNLDNLKTEKATFFFDESTLKNQLSENRRFLRHLAAHNGQLLLSSKEGMVEAGSGQGVPSHKTQIRNYDIEEIIKAADARGVRAVFFFMPMWSDNFSRLGGAAYLEPVNDYLRNLERKYPHFTYFDNLTLYPGENFMDDVHLNAAGTEIFNREYAALFSDFLLKEKK